MKHPGRALRAVVFDLDGTLVDTADDFVPAVLQLQQEFGCEALSAARIRSSVSNGSRALVKLALQMDESDSEFEPRRQRLLELYTDVLGRYARLYPGLEAFLQDLDARGIGWGIATNKPREYTDALLKTLDIRAASVVCPEDVLATKPDPECLQIACRELGCGTHEAIYVGDHARDIEAGRRAGSFTIAAAYGYIEAGDRAENWGADVIAKHSGAVPGLVLAEHGEELA